jgi:hypothetical protein
MKWKLRPGRDMAQEAFVVIEAPTSAEVEAIFWRDMDPDVIRWSNDEARGDREVIEICPARDKDELTPLGRLPARQPKELNAYRARLRRTRRSARQDEPGSTRCSLERWLMKFPRYACAPLSVMDRR